MNEKKFTDVSNENLTTRSRIILTQLKNKNEEIERWHNISVKELLSKERNRTNEMLLEVNEELERRGLEIPA